jgi:tetratricopeptide (TPR) repeat protein
VARLEAELAALDGAGHDAEWATAVGYRSYELASLRGDLRAIERADELVDDLRRQVGPWPDLCVLKATIDVKLHRVGEVRGRLDAVPGLAGTPDGRRLLADVAAQERRWDDARAFLAGLSASQDLARLAEVERLLGAYDEADYFYGRAEDDLTAKQMRSFAWIEVQRGALDVARGLYTDARAHYEQAERAYSGYWLVAKHIVELAARS